MTEKWICPACEQENNYQFSDDFEVPKRPKYEQVCVRCKERKTVIAVEYYTKAYLKHANSKPVRSGN